jgi:Porin subfamily
MPRLLKHLTTASSVALLPLLLSMPAHAVDKESLGGQDWRDANSPLQAQRDVAGGLFPGSFLIPGTRTSIRVGGYVKFDMTADYGRDPGDFVMIAKLPSTADGAANNRTGGVRLQARQSRIDVETRTPSAWGEIQTYIEGDFFGNTGGGSSTLVTDPASFSIRHAYGRLGPLLAGQTWSLAMDLDAGPETLDFGGPNGFVFIRQGQIRWTQPLSLWQVPLTLAASIENPEGDFLGKGGNNSVPDQASSNTGGSFTISPNVWNKFPRDAGERQAACR